MQIRTARALPRVGLLGNPSDGYGGKVIAFTFHDFEVRVHLRDAPRPRVCAPDGASVEADDLPALVATLGPARGRSAHAGAGTELPRAALARFLRHCEAEGIGPAILPPGSPQLSFELGFTSDIPRQVGLAGSSGIAVATLRVLAEHFATPLPPATLAELALAAETEELGITAGPQDRVVQAHEGLLYMDFRPPRTAASYRALDPSLLPPLYVAWSPAPGMPSGDVHGELRRRFEAGDPELARALDTFPALAEEGLACLREERHERLRELADRNFDTRASIWPLRPEDRELVALGRAEGAAVKLTGSGGGVVGLLREERDWPRILAAHERAGYRALRPRLRAAADEPA